MFGAICYKLTDSLIVGVGAVYWVAVFGYGSCWLADQKGYKPLVGFVVGCVAGPWGVLIYAGAPSKKGS